MKTYKQFQEGLVGSALKALGKTKLIDIAKVGIGGYAAKKGLDFLGSLNKGIPLESRIFMWKSLL